MSEIKKLRDFIRSHEMRYYVTGNHNDSSILVRKAFKVLIGESVFWVYFQYGTYARILTPSEVKNRLFETMAEAKAKTDELKAKRRKEQKKNDENAKADMEFVANYLGRFSWYKYTDSNNMVKPEAKDFTKQLQWAYDRMPDKERDNDRKYIKLLERYIRTGTIYSQGIAFRREQIVSVKYGEYGLCVEIELTNGNTIIPATDSVTKLIKTIFGDCDSWYYTGVKMPENGKDKIE